MLSVNGPEFIVIVIIALIVIGPERLPHYAQQLGHAVRDLRRMAKGAREQVKAELGDEFEDLDWQKLDPRQYDPRRIVKEALSDVWDDEPAAPGSAVAKRSTGSTAAARKSTANGSTTKKPSANPSQRSSAAPRKRATPALEAAGAVAAGAVATGAAAAGASRTGASGSSTSTVTETADLTKAAGRPGARPGGGASRPGDTTGPAPVDFEAT